jgi:hypothetical protein
LVKKCVRSPSPRARSRRRFGSRSGAATASRAPIAHSSLQARVEDVAQLVGDEVDADDRQQQRDAREEADPVFPDSRYW